MNFQGDTIRITGLRVNAKHGVYAFERRQAQEFLIDVTLELDTRQAIVSDNVNDTVHYGQLADKLAEVAAQESYNLLEKLADRLVRECFIHKKVTKVALTIHKPLAAQKHLADDISVTISRTRDEADL